MARCHYWDNDDDDEFLELTQQIADLKSDCEFIRNAVLQGRYQDALAALDQALHPRWHSVMECRNDLKLALLQSPKRGLWNHLI